MCDVLQPLHHSLSLSIYPHVWPHRNVQKGLPNIVMHTPQQFYNHDDLTHHQTHAVERKQRLNQRPNEIDWVDTELLNQYLNTSTRVHQHRLDNAILTPHQTCRVFQDKRLRRHPHPVAYIAGRLF